MKNNYLNTSSFRKRNIQKKLTSLSIRIEKAIKNGRFQKFTQKKQAKIIRRLQRYSKQLNINLSLGLRTALVGAGLLLFSQASAQITFAEQTGANNPFDGVDIGDKSSPTFVDIDNDGDFDAFIGEDDGTINYYMNIGSNVIATFAEQTGANNPLDGVDVGFRGKPAFVDIDNDGDLDAFISETYGTTKYYKNTGTNSAPILTEQTGTNNPFDGISVGPRIIITFVDIDNDSDFDTFFGEDDGTIHYYQNTGTNTAPTFAEQTGADNPFDGVDVSYMSSPTFVDIDSDGDFDAFIGTFHGNIRHFENTGTNVAPVFTDQTSTDNIFDGVDVGGRSMPAFVDIDNDGDFDSFIGNNDGVINFYKNTTITSSSTSEKFETAISLFPNPTTGAFWLDLNANYSDVSIRIINAVGQVVLTENHNEIQRIAFDIDLSKGIYFLEVKSGKQLSMMKFIKE